MKKIGFLLLITLIFNSCNLAEGIEQFQKINNDLKQHFKHDKISLSIGLGGDDNDYLKVTFYEYDVSKIEYKKLKEISKKVARRLRHKYPSFRKKEFIEVRFTEEAESNENKSFIKFTHYK